MSRRSIENFSSTVQDFSEFVKAAYEETQQSMKAEINEGKVIIQTLKERIEELESNVKALEDNAVRRDENGEIIHERIGITLTCSCGRKATCLETLRRHIQYYENSKVDKFPCILCPAEKYATALQLSRHYCGFHRIKMENKRFRCFGCENQTFVEMIELAVHNDVAHVNVPAPDQERGQQDETGNLSEEDIIFDDNRME
ncbi:unnamed protein product [Orchesella dallaii]|uniref:C2H2-type domain-containing protein n=1 Tax=Orchesella dallaii TaxID=48710 RepID=A0ABP1RX52_9HEXA